MLFRKVFHQTARWIKCNSPEEHKKKQKNIELSKSINVILISQVPNVKERTSRFPCLEQDYYITLKLGCADRSFYELPAVVEFYKSNFIFTFFSQFGPR